MYRKFFGRQTSPQEFGYLDEAFLTLIRHFEEHQDMFDESKVRALATIYSDHMSKRTASAVLKTLIESEDKVGLNIFFHALTGEYRESITLLSDLDLRGMEHLIGTQPRELNSYDDNAYMLKSLLKDHPELQIPDDLKEYLSRWTPERENSYHTKIRRS